jgi:hypothetical protein
MYALDVHLGTLASKQRVDAPIEASALRRQFGKLGGNAEVNEIPRPVFQQLRIHWLRQLMIKPCARCS